LDFLLDKGIGLAMMIAFVTGARPCLKGAPRRSVLTEGCLRAANRHAVCDEQAGSYLRVGELGRGSANVRLRPIVAQQTVEHPEIAVISTESDYRLPAIREAVHFWNAELSKLGSPFRLGSLVHVVVQAIPPGDLRDSADPLTARTRTRVAKILSQIAPTGDVIVLLSDDSNLKPFTQQRPDLQKILVVISNPPPYAQIFRGIVRNAAAHEFGHTIGLAHNDDANTLMCGNAQCDFESYSEEFLPITAKEKATLLEMYPPEWQPNPFRRWIADPPYPPGG
jgi:hypothetical protein